MPRYEFQEGSSNEFWEVTLSDNCLTTRRGKSGTEGEEKTQSFSNAIEARREYEKLLALLRLRALVNEKTGYARVDDKGGPAEDKAHGHPVRTASQLSELEKVIEKEPDNLEAYLVYGDWLQSQGDPQGELIAIQCAAQQAEGKEAKRLEQQASALVRTHKKYLLGPLEDKENYALTVEWQLGFIRSARLGVMDGYYYSDFDFAEAAKQLLALRSARFLRELSFGMAAFMRTNSYNVIDALARLGCPTLEKLSLGDYTHISDDPSQNEERLRQTALGNIEPLYKAFPNLRSLKLRGSQLELGKVVNLPELRELSVETSSSGLLNAIATATWPMLERLEVWLSEEDSSEDYDGGDDEGVGVDDIQPLLEGKNMPKLKHLGLHRMEFIDELCQVLPQAKILQQLETLDLSEGSMTDYGVDALVGDAAAFKHLKHLDVTENELSSEGMRQVAGLCERVTYAPWSYD